MTRNASRVQRKAPVKLTATLFQSSSSTASMSTAVAPDACVVEQQIDPAVALHSLPEQIPDATLCGDVGGNRLEPAAGAMAGRDHLLKRLAASPGDHDGPAVRSECMCHSGPDAAPTAGDHGDSTLLECHEWFRPSGRYRGQRCHRGFEGGVAQRLVAHRPGQVGVIGREIKVAVSTQRRQDHL
jgi:hypothetical protein